MKRERKRSTKGSVQNKIPIPKFLPELKRERKTAYKPEFVRHVYFYSLMGATDAQIAQAFGVEPPTIDLWKRNIPEFYEAMHEGKMKADALVAESLYKAAIGYEHDEEVLIPNKIREFNDKGRPTKEWTELLRTKTVKRYPPNVQAAIKWLSSRQPDIWGNKIHVDGTVQHNHKLDLSKLSVEELEVLVKVGALQQGHKNIEDADFTEEL